MKTTYQQMLQKLNAFWEEQGCILHQGYDLEVGAGTFNPATFLRCLGPEPYKAAYIEPSRRPTDGRYGKNPVRTQHYFQYQVMLKPSPLNLQDLCLKSFEAIGFNLKEHDIRFVHDDWESPTLGAWGLGWEVWMDGMEVLQYTYFQQCGGQELKPVTGELTYGTERLATYLQKVDSFFELKYNNTLTYGDIYFRNEIEWSRYNFEKASTDMWFKHFNDYEKEASSLIKERLPIPAYDFVMKASHAFNMLDARGVISVTERTGYIGRIRELARLVAEEYVASREALHFPLLEKNKALSHETRENPLLAEPLNTLDASKKGDFLLEIGSEELPALFVPIGLKGLEKGLKELLDHQALSYDSLTVYGTPRRLAAHITGLSYAAPALKAEKKGPPLDTLFDNDGKLTPQGKGFFQAHQLEEKTLSELTNDPSLSLKTLKGKDHLFVTLVKPGEPTALILQRELPKLILGLDFPKKMRWADLDISYARPLRWIVALFDTYPVMFQLGDILAGSVSYGHRQLANHSFEIPHASEYLSTLRKHYVLADHREREESIKQQILLLEKGCKVVQQEKVIPQVLHLTEWPLLTVSSFDASFLTAPKQVLISEMVEHQKYFPIENLDGTLQNKFVITANNTPSDQIRRGNQKVLSARLKDGVFLYEQDLKMSLDHLNDKLKTVTFQKDLGTVFQKVERIQKNAVILQKRLSLGTIERVRLAALYSKADLASHMVYEFPELQGIMGHIYALKGGIDSEAASAIEEHWMPRGEHSALPHTPTGQIVSLADKIDNLLGCFAAGLKPSSSSDPYSLRRQVLGMIRILIQNKLFLPLPEVLKECLAHFPPPLQKEEIIAEIEIFIAQRIKTIFLDYGFQKDESEASLSSGFSDIYDLYLRVEALSQFRKTRKEFIHLNEVYKRAKGQLAGQKGEHFHADLLQEKAERALYGELEKLHGSFSESLLARNYNKAYELIAELQPPLNTLFNEVKILADDPKIRENRLALLNKVFSLFGKVIDFSKIQIT